VQETSPPPPSSNSRDSVDDLECPKLCPDVDPQNFFAPKMTEALTALQRHFEEQYGELEVPGINRKKRKHTSDTPTSHRLGLASSDEEWTGIQDDNGRSNPPPKVVSFTETTDTTDESRFVSYGSFMVLLPLSSFNFSHRKFQSLQLLKKRKPQPVLNRLTTKHRISRMISPCKDSSVNQTSFLSTRLKMILGEYVT
jgi:hypothetical protein